MDVRELIQKFKIENKIMENDKIVGMIAYGSRVNHFENKNSDLDILLISKGQHSYHAAQVIDEINVDINIISLDEIFFLIETNRRENNRYFSSVLNTGLVEKNEEGVIDYLKDVVNSRYIGGIENRDVMDNQKQELANLYHAFKNYLGDGYNDYLYYNLLEKIRLNYNYVNNCSRCSFMKVYDIYLNNKYMNIYYQLKLPTNKFMNTYLQAIKEKEYKKRQILLNELLSIINISPETLFEDNILINHQSDINKRELEWNLVSIHNNVCKMENLLLSNHPNALFAYNVLIYKIRQFYDTTNNRFSSEFEDCFANCLKAKSDDQKIKFLEELFCFIDKPFEMNYQHYLIKMN